MTDLSLSVVPISASIGRGGLSSSCIAQGVAYSDMSRDGPYTHTSIFPSFQTPKHSSQDMSFSGDPVSRHPHVLTPAGMSADPSDRMLLRLYGMRSHSGAYVSPRVVSTVSSRATLWDGRD